jgi:hypothetical protein
MASGYELYVRHEVHLRIGMLRSRPRTEILRFLELLSSDPFQKGDYQDRSPEGRDVQVKVIGSHALRSHSGNDLQDALPRSLPHDGSIHSPPASIRFARKLTAKGRDWEFIVLWNPGDLKRYVAWRGDADGFSSGIPLRARPEPFTQSSGA